MKSILCLLGSQLRSEEVFLVRPARYAYCGESPRGATMMRNPRPEEQLRGGNEPWDRKFEGKSRLYEQKLDYALVPAYEKNAVKGMTADSGR